MAKKKMIHDFVRMKTEGEKITFLTAYGLRVFGNRTGGHGAVHLSF
jgi:hypothetical protein